MTKTETGHLLYTVALFEGREIGEDDLIAWHAVIGDLDTEVAQEALVTHYRTSTDRLMPAHIVRHALCRA